MSCEREAFRKYGPVRINFDSSIFGEQDMKSSPQFLVRWSLVLMFVFVNFGCAGMRAATARRAYIDNRAREFVYPKPIKEVWAGVRQLFFEKGYEMKARGDEEGTFTGETEWKYDNNGGSSRYLIQVNKLDEAQCTVSLTRMDNKPQGRASVMGIQIPTGGGTNNGRDLSLEWELIQRVVPDVAKAIRSDADTEAAAAAAQKG